MASGRQRQLGVLMDIHWQPPPHHPFALPSPPCLSPPACHATHIPPPRPAPPTHPPTHPYMPQPTKEATSQPTAHPTRLDTQLHPHGAHQPTNQATNLPHHQPACHTHTPLSAQLLGVEPDGAHTTQPINHPAPSPPHPPSPPLTLAHNSSVLTRVRTSSTAGS